MKKRIKSTILERKRDGGDGGDGGEGENGKDHFE